MSTNTSGCVTDNGKGAGHLTVCIKKIMSGQLDGPGGARGKITWAVRTCDPTDSEPNRLFGYLQRSQGLSGYVGVRTYGLVSEHLMHRVGG